jgi:hypothetical protein
MLGILLQILAVFGVTALARRRGGSAIILGIVAGAGVVLFNFILRESIVGSELVNRVMLPNVAVFVPGVAAWVWLGLVTLVVRFGVGSGVPQPAGMWTCSNCKTLNNQSSIYCDACHTAWAAPPVD